MKLVIRQYCPSDRDTVCTLIRRDLFEFILPCFYNVMVSPLYFTITLALCVTGYLLTSVLGAVVFPAVWIGLLYYSCHKAFAIPLRRILQKDVEDISGNYLSREDDCLWVAEAEFNGKVQVVGTTAVKARGNGKEKYGELEKVRISPMCRRMGLGLRMVQTAVDFCKERGFSKVVLKTNTSSRAAVVLYEKMGFCHVDSDTYAVATSWPLMLAKVTWFFMEKQL